LAPMLEDLWVQTDKAGRDRSEIDVAFTTGLPGPAEDGFSAAEQLERIEKMTALGITWTSTGVPGDSLEHALEALERYGREVIEPSR